MGKFLVSIPIKGTISYEVDAENEDSAKAAAWQKYGDGEEWVNEEWETWESARMGFTVEASKC